MYHRVRRKMRIVVCAILIVVPNTLALPTIATAGPETKTTEPIDNYENNVIDFDDEYSVKFSNRYGVIPWNPGGDKYVKDSHRYTVIKDDVKVKTRDVETSSKATNSSLDLNEPTTETDYSVIPLELVSTTENYLISIIESTTDHDLSVIPLSTTTKDVPNIEINQTVTLPTSTQESETTTDVSNIETTTEGLNITTIKVQTTISSVLNPTETVENESVDKNISVEITTPKTKVHITTEGVNNTLEITTVNTVIHSTTEKINKISETTTISSNLESKNDTIKLYNQERTKSVENITTSTNKTGENKISKLKAETTTVINNNTGTTTSKSVNNTENVNVSITTIKPRVTTDVNNSTATGTNTTVEEILKTNSSKLNENITAITIDSIEVNEKDVPVFTELDAEDEEVPEDYYDSKDVVPTTAPNTNALSVLVGLAGSVVESVVESVAERVVPKGIFDLFKRMQKQNADLEAERLRSREENGGLGQFGRGILKTISSGLSKPLSQLMAGAKDIGSLDTDRGFVGSLASGVTSVATVATSVADAFKDRVQAIYPGTVWCGDGHSATARSGELGLFFFTDTCCRPHDACKIYIKAGETKYGLTNTGLFTRSHCSCDLKFRECLRRTSSLVSAQIGLTYFNVLGPQCFRKAHPIVKCLKRTRITGQKCEEYEFDYTKPKMWQWFDNETF